MDDWEPLTGWDAGRRSFVSGDPEDDRLRVTYYRRKSDGALVGTAWFGPGAEGPPGHAHGGAMASVLDEAMGLGAWIAGHAVVAARITIEFRRPLPLGTTARFEVAIDHIEGKKITMRGSLDGDDGQPYATGEGLLVEIGIDRVVNLGR